jgi:hypothetical protein
MPGLRDKVVRPRSRKLGEYIKPGSNRLNNVIGLMTALFFAFLAVGAWMRLLVELPGVAELYYRIPYLAPVAVLGVIGTVIWAMRRGVNDP